MLELPREPPWCTPIGRYAVKSYQSEHDSLPAVEKERLRAFLMWLSRQWAQTGRLGHRIREVLLWSPRSNQERLRQKVHP